MKAKLKLLLQLGAGSVGIALLAWILPWTEFAAVLRGARWSLVLYAWLLFALLILLQALRFHALVYGAVGSYLHSARIIFSSFFFNNLLPGSVGGDLYKAVRVRQMQESWSFAVGRTLIDRVAGLIPLAIAAIGVLPTASGRDALAQLSLLSGRWILLPMVILGGLGIGWALAKGTLPVGQFLTRVLRESASLRATTWAVLLVLSTVALLLRILRFGVCLRIFGGDLGMADWLLFLVLLSGISLLPLSLGGLGIQEGAIVGLLALLGVPVAQATAVALLNRVLIISLACLGGIVYLTDRPTAGRDSESSSLGGG